MIKANNYFNLLFTLLILLVIGVFYFFQNISVDKRDNIYAVDEKTFVIKKALIELHGSEKYKKLTKGDRVKKINEILETLPSEYKELKKQYQIAMASLPDIAFYGRVVDQYNKPVIAAKVYYRGANAYLSEGSGAGYALTDEEGYFKLKARGAALVLGQVILPGIEYSYNINHHHVSGGGGRLKKSNRFVSIDSKFGADNWKKYTSKDKAYIIKAWRLGKYEGAVSGSIYAQLNGDGRKYTIELHAEDKRRRIKEGEEKGDFIISCQRPPVGSYKDHKDWHVSIKPVNGGVKKIKDVFLNMAPEIGYGAMINIDMLVNNSNYSKKLYNQRYYFNVENGKVYGSLLIEYRPFDSIKENICGVLINYKINSTGSRNLELKNKNTNKSNLNNVYSSRYATVN